VTDAEILKVIEENVYELMEPLEKEYGNECHFCQSPMQAQTMEEAAREHDEECQIGRIRRALLTRRLS
jgi:hypothetical protein